MSIQAGGQTGDPFLGSAPVGGLWRSEPCKEGPKQAAVRPHGPRGRISLSGTEITLRAGSVFFPQTLDGLLPTRSPGALPLPGGGAGGEEEEVPFGWASAWREEGSHAKVKSLLVWWGDTEDSWAVGL